MVGCGVVAARERRGDLPLDAIHFGLDAPQYGVAKAHAATGRIAVGLCIALSFREAGQRPLVW